jgi:hypothetical protein
MSEHLGEQMLLAGLDRFLATGPLHMLSADVLHDM